MKKKILCLMGLSAAMILAGCGGTSSSEPSVPASSELPTSSESSTLIESSSQQEQSSSASESSSQATPSSSEESSSASVPSSSIVVKHTVTFDAAGGTEVDPVDVVEGETVVRPGNPTRAGKVFLGWFTAGGAEWNFDTDVVTEDVTLVAHWALDTHPVAARIVAGSVDSDSDLAIWSAGTVLFNHDDTWSAATGAEWRDFFVVDADGRLMYGCFQPVSGFGGPGGGSFLYHQKYSSWAKNPAFIIGDKYSGAWPTPAGMDGNDFQIVVPEGGFGITGYGEVMDTLCSALTDGETDVVLRETADLIALNQYNPAINDKRLSFDAENNELVISTGIHITAAADDYESGMPAAYTSSDLFEAKDYVIGVNGEGRIIYASRVGGYGGPSDGFYHDGSYVLTPGEVCGVFDVDTEFAPWPATTAGGDNAWTKFSYVVPEGGYLITGTLEDMKDLVLAITGLELTDDANVLFEGTLQKGALNDVMLYSHEDIIEVEFVVAKEEPIPEEPAEVTSFNGILDAQSSKLPTIYNSDSTTIVARDYTIGLDADGKVIFASYTAPGYGGPADGFYHDGSYQCTAGQVCGVFDLDPEFAGWPNVTAGGLNAWTLYSFVVPEGGHLITGELTNMSDAVAFMFGYDLASYANNVLFEATMIDGAFNDLRFDVAEVAGEPGTYEITLREQPVVVTSFLGVLDGTDAELPTIYNDASAAVTLRDYTIALDANGQIMFASYTHDGYGGPADGFYHNGSYVATAGQVCGIFNLDPEFAPWPATTAGGLNAWTLYTVVVPAGGYIITGDFAQMKPVVEFMLNEELPGEANNTFFESTLVDGAFNDLYFAVAPAAEEGKLEVSFGEAPAPKSFYASPLHDASYYLDIYDEYAAAIEEKEAGITLPTEVVSEIYTDNADNQMWADSGFSSIVYNDNATFQSKSSAWGNCIMMVNADGKIEFIGGYENGARAFPSDNFYLRAPTKEVSPCYDAATGNLRVPEGGWAVQVWTGANGDPSHHLAYTGFDPLRALVINQIGEYYPVSCMEATTIVGEGDSKTFGANNSKVITNGSENILFSNFYTGFLDDLTVTKDSVTHEYFTGKITVTRTNSLKSIIQRSLIKSEFVRTKMTWDDGYNPTWCINAGIVRPGIESYLGISTSKSWLLNDHGATSNYIWQYMSQLGQGYGEDAWGSPFTSLRG